MTATAAIQQIATNMTIVSAVGVIVAKTVVAMAKRALTAVANAMTTIAAAAPVEVMKMEITVIEVG
jgi:hypothetical protein